MAALVYTLQPVRGLVSGEARYVLLTSCGGWSIRFYITERPLHKTSDTSQAE